MPPGIRPLSAWLAPCKSGADRCNPTPRPNPYSEPVMAGQGMRDPPAFSLAPRAGFAQKVPSFRGVAEGRESGIHEHQPLEYGFRVRRCAPPRNDEFLCKAPVCRGWERDLPAATTFAAGELSYRLASRSGST